MLEIKQRIKRQITLFYGSYILVGSSNAKDKYHTYITIYHLDKHYKDSLCKIKY